MAAPRSLLRDPSFSGCPLAICLVPPSPSMTRPSNKISSFVFHMLERFIPSTHVLPERMPAKAAMVQIQTVNDPNVEFLVNCLEQPSGKTWKFIFHDSMTSMLDPRPSSQRIVNRRWTHSQDCTESSADVIACQWTVAKCWSNNSAISARTRTCAPTFCT